MDINRKLASELGVLPKQVDAAVKLIDEGNTIPFIARYRKEKTGNLDETQIKAIIDMDKSLTALQDRKETVLAKIEAQGKLTDQLKAAIEAGRSAYLSGLGRVLERGASASDPLTGFLRD